MLITLFGHTLYFTLNEANLLTVTFFHMVHVDLSTTLTAEGLVRVGLVGEVVALTAPVLVHRPRHSLLHTEPRPCRHQPQPTLRQGVVRKLRQPVLHP